jgi:hypothetical protein
MARVRAVRLAAVALFCLAANTGQASAQAYANSAGFNAGGVWFTDFNAGSGPSAASIGLDPGWIIGLQFDHWFGSGRFGARLNGATTQRPIELPGRSPDIGLWMLDAGFLMRVLPAEPDRAFNMFLSLGAGAVHYALGAGELFAVPTANATYDGDNRARLAASAGVGFDILTMREFDGDRVGIRFEVVDHVALASPFEPISGSDFQPVHNIRFVIGLFTGFGMLQR